MKCRTFASKYRRLVRTSCPTKLGSLPTLSAYVTPFIFSLGLPPLSLSVTVIPVSICIPQINPEHQIPNIEDLDDHYVNVILPSFSYQNSELPGAALSLAVFAMAAGARLPLLL